MAALVALALVSCDFMYETNFFQTEMGVDATELSKASVADLNEMADSPSFFTALAEDEEAKTAVLDNLDEVIADPASTPEEVAEASLLAAEVEIYSSPAGDLVSNVGELLISAVSGGEGGEPVDMEDPEALINALLPESVVDEETGEIVEDSFVAMINALNDSYAYYVEFSEAMDPADYTSSELGDAAMTAMMASIIASIDPVAGYDSPGDLIYAALTGEYAGEITMSGELGTDTNLQALFDAAGLADLFSAEEPVTP